ncbi:MAG: S8 family serine peptidase [Gemmatimonadales bacterium]|nr:S8 family serine peptidase [Gemmatimonadales bacterium]
MLVQKSDRPGALGSLFMVVLLSLSVVAVPAADPGEDAKIWNYMPSAETGTQAFRTANSNWDGRGVAVAILDTGVDAFAPGLLETSTGQVKLIDVRDFSTEGDWETVEAELDESGTESAPVFKTEDGLLLRGAAELPVPPAVGGDSKCLVYIGVIAEKQFVNNSDVNDLNDDGDTSDKFGFLIYAADRAAVEDALGVGLGYEMLMNLNETARQTIAGERLSEKVWVVVVDTDGNGDLADEKLLRDYRVNYDAFSLSSDNNPDSRSLMAWEVNVRANEDHLGKPLAPTAEFHFDDGSHGSHCAGIAAGHGVSGQKGLEGGAPGSWLLSLKLGDNRLAGGATRTSSMKKAYEYAASFEEKYGIPVVVNMSFGIDSVEEGDDAMGGWLNDMLADNPTLYVCTSAGNSGPGLSTVGLPATAYSLISSGASISPGVGEDLYNAGMERATLFNFSSRGGETCKPDIVAPGGALSTVPGFVDGMARFNGTSMASPQTAGAVACLVGAAAQEGLEIHWGMMKRALIAGGSPIPGLSLLDQGGGLVNTGASWDILKKLSASRSAHKMLWYQIETPCPIQNDGKSEAAYWRTPGGAPLAPERVTFTVRPVFHPDLGPDEIDTFFRSFSFKSEAAWLKVVSGDRYLRGDMGMTVVCEYDGRKLTEPGSYEARIIASLDSGDLGGLAGREFYLWNTVVTGDPVGAESGFTKVYQGKDLAQSSAHRYYVNSPAGATAMRVRLEVSEDVGSSRGAAALIEINNPEGFNRGGFTGYATVDRNPIRDAVVLGDELYPGIWEINIASSITARDLTDYQVTISFDGYQVEPAEISDLNRPEPGEDASSSFTVTRAFPGVFRGEVKASIEGFCREQEVEISETDEWTLDFVLDSTTPRVQFHLVMDEEVGNFFTDCAVNILDSSGKALRVTGFDGLEVDAGITLPSGKDSVSYKLQVVGAFAIAEDMADWGFDLEEKYFLAQKLTGSTERTGEGPLNLHCGVPAELEATFSGDWPQAPEGMSTFGSIRFEDKRTDDRRPGDQDGRLVLEVPIRVE